MKILGIDPGYAILGYGVVEKIGNKFKVCDYGAITTDAGTPMTERLEYLYDSLREARGVAILACVKGGLEIEEYTPLQIKQALVGYGRADKKQVQIMVKTILNLKEIPKPDDTADALAAAICHGHSADTRKMLREIKLK